MIPDESAAAWAWGAAGVYAALCLFLALMAYVRGLYVEMLHFRAKERPLAYSRFEDDYSERLGWSPEDARRRFGFLSQIAIALMAPALVVALTAAGMTLLPAVAWGAGAALVSLLLFGHALPVMLISYNRGAWLSPLLGPLRLLGWLAGPISHSAHWAASSAIDMEDEADENGNGDDDDIDVLLDAGEEEGLLDPEDRELIESVVNFNDMSAAEVMTPRAKVVAVDQTTPLVDVRDLVREHDYSRMPVYKDSMDDVIGVLHGRDAMLFEGDELARRTAASIVQPILHIPETKRTHSLLRELQAAKQNMAAVIDEYGNMTGIVTIEDIVEEIVGEIPGEDPDTPDILLQSDGSYLADGGCELEHLNRVLGKDLAPDAESTTLGGLACEVLGKMPSRGASFEVDGVPMEVLATDGRRVTNLRIWPVGAPRAL